MAETAHGTGRTRASTSRRAKADTLAASMDRKPISPPASNSPPSHGVRSKSTQNKLRSTRQRSRPGSEPVNADALARALQDFEDAGRQRERTPGSSPSRKRQRVYGDRYVPDEPLFAICTHALSILLLSGAPLFISIPFHWSLLLLTNASRFIPNRDGQDLQAGFSLLHEDGCPSTPSKTKKKSTHGEIHSQKSKSWHDHYMPSPCLLLHLQRRRPIGRTLGYFETNSSALPFLSPTYILSHLIQSPAVPASLGISALIPLSHIRLLCLYPRLASLLPPPARIYFPIHPQEMFLGTLLHLEHHAASMALILMPAPTCIASPPSDLTVNKFFKVSENSLDM